MTPRMFYTLARVLAALTVIPFHEAGHALAAWLLGDPTAKQQGRLSLNPFLPVSYTHLVAALELGGGILLRGGIALVQLLVEAAALSLIHIFAAPDFEVAGEADFAQGVGQSLGVGAGQIGRAHV